MRNQPVAVDGCSLTIEDVYEIAVKGRKVKLSDAPGFLEKLQNSREFIESYMREGRPIYGVTTGFGDSCNHQISPEKSDQLQNFLVDFHGIGIGEAFSEAEGRAITLVRLNSNVKGYSAIRPELAELMLDMLNKGIAPVIPQLGSVGASGDLTPLSYLAAVLMGKRKVYYKGGICESEKALKAESLKPLQLQAKEGLAIMNGTSVMTAVAAIAWADLNKIADISDFITAATVEIIGGNDIPFRGKVSEIKNHKGQIKSAARIYGIIKDSGRVCKYEELLQKIGTIDSNHYRNNSLKIQDRYSVRCAPQINGGLRDTLSFTKTWIENEINSANDNPLIDPDEQMVYNSGNFYGGHVALACDYLRIALANSADLADKQSALIIDGKFNNLTENLIPLLDQNSPLAGLLHGFKAAQISISALSSEMQYLSAPVSIHSRPTEALNQDKVSLGTISARKLKEAVELCYLQLSIHLLAVLQAIDLIGVKHFSPVTQKVYSELRNLSKFVDKDRPLDEDALRVKNYLKERTGLLAD